MSDIIHHPSSIFNPSALTVAAHEQGEFGALTAKQRDQVKFWLATLKRLRGGETRAAAAARLGVSLPTLTRKLGAFRREGWRGLVPDWKNPASELTPEFLDWWKNLAESNQRKTRPAFRKFREMWRKREPIPGLEGHPGWPNLPRGCSYENLSRLLDKFELVSFRIGKGAAAGFLPQTFSTRLGLWAGSHYMLDDMWQDFFVNVLDRNQAVRPLMLHGLDVYSGHLCEWGCRPRLRNLKQDKQHGLLERDTRLLLAALLFKHGYHAERGTVIMAEHGTAAVRDRVAQILHDHSGGKITVRRSGMTGAEQALTGLYEGDGKGNFRFKAALESWHNLAHNELAFLPGQTGKDLEHRPEHLHGLLTRNSALLQARVRLSPERAAKLVYPLVEWSQFVLKVSEGYARINARTDHDLTDWAECGHIVSEFRLSPDSDQWLGAAAFARLPEETRTLLSSLGAGGAAGFTRARRMSPREVWTAGRAALTPLHPSAVCAMLTRDLAAERRTDGAYFEFDDSEVAAGTLRYEAVLIGADGRRRELPRGEKFLTFVNPFAPEFLFVQDAAERYLGMCPRATRASYADVEATQRQWGRNATREKEIYKDMAIRRQPWSAAQAAEREWNNDVIGGATPDDRAARREEQSLTDATAKALTLVNQQNNNTEAEYDDDNY